MSQIKISMAYDTGKRTYGDIVLDASDCYTPYQAVDTAARLMKENNWFSVQVTYGCGSVVLHPDSKRVPAARELYESGLQVYVPADTVVTEGALTARLRNSGRLADVFNDLPRLATSRDIPVEVTVNGTTYNAKPGDGVAFVGHYDPMDLS